MKPTMKIEAMKISLEEMHFYAYHGVFPQERCVGNDFVLQLTLWAEVAGMTSPRRSAMPTSTKS